MLDSGYQGTFVDFAENVRDDVAQWGADYVDRIVKALMPDGRPFGAVKLNEGEELKLYMKTLRGNGQAWDNWIDGRIQTTQTLLKNSGLDDDTIIQAHPYSIVAAVAVAYSAKMERLLEEEENLALKTPLHPMPLLSERLDSERQVPSLPEF